MRIDGQDVRTGEAIATDSDTVSIALRPESISLGSANGHANTLSATVEDVYFMGSVVRVRTRVGEQHLNVDTFNSAGMIPPRPGEQVTLTFSRDAAKVLADAHGDAQRSSAVG